MTSTIENSHEPNEEGALQSCDVSIEVSFRLQVWHRIHPDSVICFHGAFLFLVSRES